ncbi:MAG: bifunctional N(6)-L-threonylcarbamoyladenine synthase/serine/threonine protein kinase, partial [Halobacteriaceae archaeon]
RSRSNLTNPVCLNASGANAHVLAFQNGRYQILGETMDTGVGNAIDKFTRYIGWSHPGGPKVENNAKEGDYIELPYVVKGMDFSFSGIMSAAKAAYDDGTPVEDICCGLQETIFAMLTEVSERALSLTSSDELILGGGVGQNQRLQSMLDTMCTNRGAEFSVPEDRFLRDNAGMIAVLGAKMYNAGETICIEDSSIRPDFRPDEVSVSWRDVPDQTPQSISGTAIEGAEATITVKDDRVIKRRQTKQYRHPQLDALLRRNRTVMEARLTSEARRVGVPTPIIYDIDVPNRTIEMEYVGTQDLKEAFSVSRLKQVGKSLASMHNAGFVHGDPTVRNIRIDDDYTYLIDFGLGYYTDDIEDYAMDLHVLYQSIRGTANNPDPLYDAAKNAYANHGSSRVLDQLEDISRRGRYQ